MYLMLNGAPFFFCFRANQTPNTTRTIARKLMNPIAMTTPPFMPPPFLDIVIAVIFGVGVVDLAMSFSGAIAGKAELVGASAWDILFWEAGGEGGGGGGNAREGRLVSGDFIARGDGETEVGGDETAINREGEGERAGEGGAVPKGGEGDACGRGEGDKFTDGGGEAWGGCGGIDRRGRRDRGGKEGEGASVDNGGGDDCGRGGGER
nr:putative glycine-rich cell wall structural protein 1 [Coffea arabica]